MDRDDTIAIIGAGIAGAAAARRLHAAGRRVVVLDKGRGPGGRMATRRGPGALRFDHGAQYFTARDPRFAAQVAEWAARGVAAPWGGPGRSVGVPGMTAPVRDLLAGLDVQCGRAVGRLVREDRRWRLAEADGAALAGGAAFTAVLLTCPAPQSLALLAGAGLDLPGLAEVRYAPCWTLMLAHDGPPPLDGPVRENRDPDATIAWVAQDGAKPGREGATVVVQAAPAWSRAHLEEDAADIAERLLDALRDLPDVAGPVTVGHRAAHRWRYARVERAIGEPCLYAPGTGLGFAGDGCLGPRVESAYLSGLALAERVLAESV
ncbi:NAD(P)/FAD-dependent oxidoreductase [Methylobacterium nonmethylotrophicum]|uniref:FAD-dependent oxidoreductase n=1 Tax=Methylobacterium nonmethylotrophicum TaxID=1141884 RepID=A0A4Z0NHT5_9HYPH|nr:FAD-dependent oxidoreductase [Methylobacterium nonmethylotrophicum]TGD95146.1 FAD-dependent oxidoreductase [Methylobacterium nonmethylotrophicum]